METHPPDESGPLVTPHKVLTVDAQVRALHVEIRHLERRLQEAELGLSACRAEQLLKANEQLVLAALEAQALAEAATQELDMLARAGQRDPLTDTPNRTLMEDRLTSAINMAQRRNTRIAVIFVDLDGFKAINDTLGHATGDAVLQHVARQLGAAVRDSDAVGRHGGDEFLVLLAEVAQLADVAAIASKMLRDIGTPCTANNHTLTLSASLGIALYPDHGHDGQILISLADAAMYQSKRGGGGRFSFHTAVPASAERSDAGTELGAATAATGVSRHTSR